MRMQAAKWKHWEKNNKCNGKIAERNEIRTANLCELRVITYSEVVRNIATVYRCYIHVALPSVFLYYIILSIYVHDRKAIPVPFHSQ